MITSIASKAAMLMLRCRCLAGWRAIPRTSVFPKTRSAETAEVARALQAQKTCETDHGTAHQVFDREVN